MGYLDDLMKGTKRTSNNINSLGAYSPLSGFSNEDELENGITVEINKEEEPKTETIAEEKAKKSPIATVIVWIITVAIIGLCILVVYKKAKKGNDIE